MPYDQLPKWIRAGVQAVIKGPSAVNKQPVVFSYRNDTLTAAMPGQTYEIRFNDLGIAKLHFQIAAESCGVAGTWEWGEGGAFTTPLLRHSSPRKPARQVRHSEARAGDCSAG